MGLFKFTKKKKNRVCVIGLDGVPHTLLTDLADQGVMPAFKTLIEKGSLHRMKASLPEISAVSWTNFMTGTNPGTHGIFGFTDLKEGSYDLRFPNFHDVKADTIWDILGRQGKQSIVINQPSTYPARRISGLLVSGFVAIEMAKAVYPLSYKAPLEKMGYEIDIDTFRAREDHRLLWNQLENTLEGRRKAFRYFWSQDWDYFELVITGTDRLMHFLWDAYPEKDHPHHQKFLDYYKSIDGIIDEIAGEFEKLTGGLEGLFLLSDHGFTGIEQEVHLNAYLARHGWLAFENEEPKNLGEITADSKAFAMDPNRIYIHSKDRYPKGRVNPGDRDAVKKDLISLFEGMEYQGKKVVRKVFDAEEIYSGPEIPKGPDLIVLSHPGFDMKGSFKKKETFGRTSLQGMHTWDDAFFWAKDPISDDLGICDPASHILEKLGTKKEEQ
jgi:predicted AlkP superfamily phosphohydrolase/phosphomutase